jgi:hypothetical protein
MHMALKNSMRNAPICQSPVALDAHRGHAGSDSERAQRPAF